MYKIIKKFHIYYWLGMGFEVDISWRTCRNKINKELLVTIWEIHKFEGYWYTSWGTNFVIWKK